MILNDSNVVQCIFNFPPFHLIQNKTEQTNQQNTLTSTTVNNILGKEEKL